jgi:phage-related minor tail protein
MKKLITQIKFRSFRLKQELGDILTAQKKVFKQFKGIVHALKGYKRKGRK